MQRLAKALLCTIPSLLFPIPFAQQQQPANDKIKKYRLRKNMIQKAANSHD